MVRTSSEMEKAILGILDDLQNLSGDRQENIAKLKQMDQNILLKIAVRFLENDDSNKRSLGIKALMLTNPENHINVVLPLLDDDDFDVRWTATYYIIRSDEFLENIDLIDRVIKLLLEDPMPEIRVAAAEALGYCKTTPNVISALEYARDHDFEPDSQGYYASYTATTSLKRIRSSQ